MTINQKKMYLVDKYQNEYIVKDKEDIDIIHMYFHSMKNTNSSVTVLNKNHKTVLLNIKEIISYSIVDRKHIIIMLDRSQYRDLDK